MVINSRRFFSIVALLSWCGFVFFRESTGFFILISLFLGVLFSKKKKLKISRKYFGIILVYCVSWILYIISTEYAHFPSTYFNVSLLMLLMIIYFFIIKDGYSKQIDTNNFSLEDILYYFLFFYYLYYTIRLHKEDRWTEFGGTYVSFSIELILVYLIGYKKRHFISACALMILALFFVPARTLKLFFLIHLLTIIIPKIRLRLPFNFPTRIGKLMFILFVLTTVMAFFIGIFFPRYLDFFDGHGEVTQLYDASNVARFRAHVYSIAVLLRKINLFWGIANEDYLNILDLGFPVYHHPHNSYLQLLVFYSISFGFLSLYFIAKIMNSFYQGKNVSIIIPFLFIACIYHDLFATQLFFILVVLNIEERPKKIRKCKTLYYLVKYKEKEVIDYVRFNKCYN